MEEIDAELKLLNNAEGIKSSLTQVVSVLKENESPIVQQLKVLFNQLQQFESFHPGLPSLLQRFQSAQIEIQDIADFTGDSLRLAQEAKKTNADVILFCGVHFMAETASIICPDKKVLVPDVEAGCSLADMITPQDVIAWKEKNPGGAFKTFVQNLKQQ